MNHIQIPILIMLLMVYVWTFYQIPILAVGVRNLKCMRIRGKEKSSLSMKSLPVISVIVPVKNEEKVVERLLKVLLRLDYPDDKKEIIIVEDGSIDRTVEICQRYVRLYPNKVRLLHKQESNGKPSALNYALKYAKGEIVAVFDADNVPEPNALKRAVKYFHDSSVAAVQGRLCSINADENMLTKFASYEEAVWCEVCLRGKDALGLFVNLKGSCQFIRRDILAKLNGFNEETLAEDLELSVRLVEKGYKIRYASDVCSWQETPSQVGQLFKQRTRWFTGTMQVAFNYGRLMTKIDKRNLDVELTLLGPFILIASLTSYLLAFFMSLAAFNFDFMLHILLWLSAISTSIILVICGFALAYVSKPRRLINLLWLPFMYFYWSLQALIASYALVHLAFRRPVVWMKTEKSGQCTNNDLIKKLEMT
ncbi:MAG: glycosyltransferase family 2 protein [Candidatus Bathyarchaeia archaeon]